MVPNFESRPTAQPKPPTCYSDNPDIVETLQTMSDEMAERGYHPLLAESDFTDSTRDLALGAEVTEIDPTSLGLAAEIISAQEKRYTELQGELLNLEQQLERASLTPNERTELGRRLIRLKEVAAQNQSFLEKAKGFKSLL